MIFSRTVLPFSFPSWNLQLLYDPLSTFRGSLPLLTHAFSFTSFMIMTRIIIILFPFHLTKRKPLKNRGRLDCHVLEQDLVPVSSWELCSIVNWEWTSCSEHAVVKAGLVSISENLATLVSFWRETGGEGVTQY